MPIEPLNSAFDNTEYDQWFPVEAHLPSVAIPDWADMDEGYKPTLAEKMDMGKFHVLIVSYVPKGTMGIGYTRLFVVESDTNRPFPKMDKIWEEIYNANKDKSSYKLPRIPFVSTNMALPDIEFDLPDGVSVTEDGKFRNAFGKIEAFAATRLAEGLATMYGMWKQFPNEEDFSMVRKLLEARYKVHGMLVNVNDMEHALSSARDSLRECQNRIAELETKMNQAYEDGAEALNLLEEHGIKVDLNEKPNDWFESCGLERYAFQYSNIALDNSGISIIRHNDPYDYATITAY